MKQLFLFVFLLSTFTSFAQFEKGTRTIGFNLGSIGFTNFQQTYDLGNRGIAKDTRNTFFFSVQPSMGKFFSENLLIGGGPSLNFSTTKFTSSGNSFSGSTFTGGVNLFGRYYFGSEGFMPYAQVNLGAAFGGGSYDGNAKGDIGTLTFTSKYTEDLKSIFNLSAGAGFGFTKLLNKHVGLDAAVYYQFNRNAYNYKSVTDRTYSNNNSDQLISEYKYAGLSNNVAVSLGIIVFLDPKK
jgi:hypothetical protein